MKRIVLFLIVSFMAVQLNAEYWVNEVTHLDEPTLLGSWGVYEASATKLPIKFIFEKDQAFIYEPDYWSGEIMQNKYLAYIIGGSSTGEFTLHFVGGTVRANGFARGWRNYIVKSFDGTELTVSDYDDTYTLKLRKDYEPTDPNNPNNPDNPQQNIESVDLGLNVIWATCNLGASTPYESGNYYAWGETIPNKAVYNESTYTPDWNSLPNNIAGTQYDPVHVEIGNGWHMPTYFDFVELVNNCVWEYSEADHGYYVKGPNGNQIFFPFVGGKEDEYNVGYIPGVYWGQGFYMSDTKGYTYLYNNYLYMDDDPRYGLYQYLATRGQCVRPVKSSSNSAKVISNDSEGCVDVYNVSGQLEFINVPLKDLRNILPKGIHVINGSKILIE